MATPDANIIISADASGVQKAVSVAKGSLEQLQKQVTGLQTLSAKVMPVLGIDALGLSAGDLSWNGSDLLRTLTGGESAERRVVLTLRHIDNEQHQVEENTAGWTGSRSKEADSLVLFVRPALQRRGQYCL